ncbi:MAG: riboflavin synthase [Phycisphaerae bacterium]
MFAGIVECTGTVASLRVTPGGRRLAVESGNVSEGAVCGASIAVDGVCLTVARIDGTRLEFDVITESLDRSTLGSLEVSDRVNLERSLRTGDRIDGHFVQGHVDGTATLSRKQVSQRQWVLWFRATPQVMRYIIPKGSVAVSGVSLTVAAVAGAEFSVALIPTTLDRTTLGSLEAGHPVNIETDILVRTIVHTLDAIGTDSGLSAAKLKAHGYL